MITAARPDVDRLMILGTAVIALAGGLSSAACASVGWHRSALTQPTPPSVRGAGVVPGSWEKVEPLPAGSPLVVTLKTGGQVEGAFKALQPDTLTLADPAGKELIVPRSAVLRIAARASDKLTNGAVVGAGIGLGAALTVLAIVASEDGYVLPSAKWAAPLLLSGLGSLVGILADRAHKIDEVIHVAEGGPPDMLTVSPSCAGR
jgi:hypothetical protein